jgi:hypothetical protein
MKDIDHRSTWFRLARALMLCAVVTACGSAAPTAPSPTVPAVTVTPVLKSLALSPTTVEGGKAVTGTATLTGAAPEGGAVVALTAGDPATVPAGVTVPAGASSAAFDVGTRVVGGTISTMIGGSYGGASASVLLSVTGAAPVTIATASFGVTGPTESDTCALSNNGGTINCTFNGSTSTAPGTITAWDWSYSVSRTFAQTTSGAVLTNPAVDCGLLPAPPLPAGVTWFPLTVTLTIHDSLGNVSRQAVNSGARLFPQGSCGF